MPTKQYYVYIATNPSNSVLYTGVTNNLVRRIYEHKQKKYTGFTVKYNVTKLAYFEAYSDVREAIAREKQIKGGSRRKKLELIEKSNSNFADLYESIL